MNNVFIYILNLVVLKQEPILFNLKAQNLKHDFFKHKTYITTISYQTNDATLPLI